MTEREQLEQSIAALEAQRVVLGDAVVEPLIAAAREKLEALKKEAKTARQRKLVTVLFADVSGFTAEISAAMSERIDAEAVSDLMNALWTRLDGAITAHGGMIDKHIGDAVMALFGAPTAREDDVERAIRAALAMQEELATFRDAQQIELAMRIGINTGPVLLGEVGTTGEYTAIGDAVNLASRLEHAAPMGGVLISHDTYRHVRGIFSTRTLEPIQVKGKAEPVQVYTVQGLKARPFRLPTRGVEGVETRMVGRDAELRHLQDALHTVLEEGRMHVVTVVGDAGLGKSRLLHEFKKWVELLPEEVLYFRGRADQRTSNAPYYLLRDVFFSRFEIQDSDEAEAAREKLERGILSFMGADARMQAHFIGHLIGLDFAASPYLRSILGDARQIHDRAFHYATRFFAAATRPPQAGTVEPGPAMLLLDDLHWADDGSLDFFEHLAQEGGRLPLLIVALTRPDLFERRPAWGTGQAHQTRLELRPLSERDSQRLVEEILRKVEHIAPDLCDLIVRRASGNPFYAEELIKMLVERDVIVKGEERWHFESGRLTEIGIPPTLTGVLQARLDKLPTPERGALQRASVVGRIFWDGAVAQLNGQTVRALGTLQERELVFERQTSAFGGEHEYIFKHTILHDVTYESVLKRLRRLYHARVADWLVARGGERSAEYAVQIGEHYERAGREVEAAQWYAQAGRRAQDAYAPDAAVAYYRKALKFLPEGSQADRARRIELYRGLGLMLHWKTRFEEASEAYEAMRAGAEAVNDAVAHARAWEGLAAVQRDQGNYRAALEVTEQAARIARNAGAPGQAILAAALYNEGWIHFELGEMDAALSLGERALRLSTELAAEGGSSAVEARRVMADSLNLLGWARRNAGQYEQAEHHFERALALARDLGDRVWVARMLNNLGIIAEAREEYHKAAPIYREALEVARELGHRQGEIVMLNNLGGAKVGLEEYGAAEADLRQAIEMAEAVGWGGLSESYRFLAQACLGQGKVNEALEWAERALELGQEMEVQEDIGRAWRVLGQILRRCSGQVIAASSVPEGDPDIADCFARSLEVFTETGMEGERARTLRAWARYEMEHGDSERGAEMLEEARRIRGRLGVGKAHNKEYEQ